MNASNASDDKSARYLATTGTCARLRPATSSGPRTTLRVLGLSVLALVSCTAVPASQQQHLAKANMVFDDTNAFAFSARLLPQAEPRTSTTGAAQGGGCTACK